jgi:hypothetical protein
MRANKPRCPRCNHPGYWRSNAADGRPAYECDKCGDWWTCGHSGGEYEGHEMGARERGRVRR